MSLVCARAILRDWTVAVRLRSLAGVLNPAGLPTVIEVTPAAMGINWVWAVSAAAATDTGDAEIWPTEVTELVTLTLAENPPRTD